MTTRPSLRPKNSSASTSDGPLNKGGGFYHKSIKAAIDRDGDTLTVIDVLAKQVGVRAMFSDWPATTTFYASCMGMK
jgi:glycerophosphoryl diester phosphodiesterase